GTMPRFEDERLISVLLTIQGGIGVLFSAWLTYLELGVIHAICMWCVTSAVIVTLILVASVVDLRETGEARTQSETF
ncbi:MAG: vitamin K epoxide reductase family protein, partial [Gemmatimonadaceae bacterium]